MAELCLLCSAPFPRCVPPGDVVLDIPGACGSQNLGRRLEQIFILRRVLGMEVDSIEDLLRGWGVGNTGEGEWLKCCEGCMRGRVQEMWVIWREVERLQRKLKGMSDEVKHGIREQILRGDLGEGTCNWQIKRRLFPELFIKAEYPVGEGDVIEYLTFETPSSPAPASSVPDLHEQDPSDPDFEPEAKHRRLKIFQDISLPKRKRGRPPLPAHLRKKRTEAESPKRKAGKPPKAAQLRKKIDIDPDPDAPKRNVEGELEIEYLTFEAPSSPAPVSPHPADPLKHHDDYVPASEEEQDSSDPDFEPKNRRLKILQNIPLSKRRRGRPPAHLRRAPVVDPNLPKRRRGRPPKPKNPDGTATPSTSTSTAQAIETEEAEADPISMGGFPFEKPSRLPKLPSRPRSDRGRKRIPRPSFRHPLYYYAPYWGTLRRKRWHWTYCPLCPARYRTPEEISLHQQNHQDQKEGRLEGLHFCPHCTFLTRSPEELQLHQKRHTRPKKPATRYSCPHCPFSSVIWKILAQHQKKEHDSTPSLTCQVCGYQAANMGAYNRHRTASHPDGEIALCEYCPRKFPSQYLLQKHVDNEHNRINLFICDVCGKGFPNHTELQHHKVFHMPKDQQNFICDLCGLGYGAKTQLYGHMRKAHKMGKGKKAGEEPRKEEEGKVYKCKWKGCSVESPYKFYIRQHLDTHRAEMKYECEICGKRYVNPQGKWRHKKLIHQAETSECPYCHKQFTCEDYMKDHVKKFCKIKKMEDLKETGTVEAAQEMEMGAAPGTMENDDVGHAREIGI